MFGSSAAPSITMAVPLYCPCPGLLHLVLGGTVLHGTRKTMIWCQTSVKLRLHSAFLCLNVRNKDGRVDYVWRVFMISVVPLYKFLFILLFIIFCSLMDVYIYWRSWDSGDDYKWSCYLACTFIIYRYLFKYFICGNDLNLYMQQWNFHWSRLHLG